MQACVDILNAKRIPVNGTSLDTVETLKEKISKETGLSPCLQTLHVLQNGATVEWKDDSSIYFGDLLKKKAVIYLSSKRGNSSSSYYINIVTETGRVLLVTPEGGKSVSINDLKQQLSIILDLRADSLFLRIVELSNRINRPLGELFNTLEDYGVISGSVLYVQIHPWSESWFHGKIGRDLAEEIMSSASEGQFLVKESVSFPGDYVLFVCDAGQVKHFKVSCHKNMMFTINGRNFFYTIAEMIQFYMSKEGLLIKGKLKEHVTRSELSEYTGGEGLTTTGSSSVRPRLYTTASTEIHIHVVIGSKTFSLLTSTLNQVQSLKAQIEEKSGQPADCQLLRLNDKLLVMDSFHLSDYHVMENSTIYVQVHPWDEDWYVGDLTHDKIDSLVKSMSTVPKDGMFLIKDSSTSPGNYCLYVWWKGKPVRYLVEFKKNRFAIGNDHQFNTLSDLIESYRKNGGRLKSQLTDPVKIDKDLKCLIPPAVVARGSKAKAAYRRALENGKTRNVRVRIMLIGEGKAGKTSLKRFLKGEKFNKHEASTLGVDMDAPLLKDGLKAWSAHRAVENISVFDHRSAQLVVRQLSDPNCEDIHNLKERFKGMPSTTDYYEGPPSPFLQDDVFTSDQVISDPLPRNMANLVEDVLTSDQDPSDNLPQNVANLIERMLRQEQFSASEEVWPVIWDFSGQSLLHGMNPIFMSREAVYLLVCDLTKDLFSKEHTGRSARATNMQHRADSCLDHLVRWMDLVHSFQDTSAGSVTSSAQPPVILVGTHADKVSGDPWNRLEAILDSFHGKQFSSHIVDKFSVDNTRAGQAKEDPTILRLRQKIISVASSLPHTKREIPLQWLFVEKVLHRLAGEGFKYITLQQFKEVAKRVGRFQVHEDSDELLHFLCDCGAVLYFNETDESNSLVFLDPQWLVRLFCQIINIVSGKKEPMNIRQCRQTLAKKGILSEELVNFACQQSDLNLSKESLLSVMEKASLVCRLEVQNGEVVYLVPSMLPATPENEILGLIDQYMTAPVYITFNTGYIPYGLFSRFVVLFSDWASKKYSARPPKMSANTARFFIGKKKDYSLTFAFFKSVVMVHVLREGSKEEETEMTAICQQVYRCIEDILDSLHLRCHWLHSITWKLCARCDLCLGESEGHDGCSWHHIPSCLHPDCAHFIPLGPDWPLRCEQTIKARTLLDEDKLEPWLKLFRRNHFADDRCLKPGVVSLDDLLYLAHDVGLQWKRLCRVLLGAKEVEYIDHDQKTLDDKCYTMLDRWKKSQTSDATYAALGMALMHEDLQAQELCAKYCLQPQVPLESRAKYCLHRDKVPSEIKALGPRAKLAYENALKTGKVRVYRARIMLIGQDRAGKTSLKKSFLSLPFDPGEKSTDGIEVEPSKFEVDIDRVRNWKHTDEKWELSQFAADLAKMVAKELQENTDDQEGGDEEINDEDNEFEKEGDVYPVQFGFYDPRELQEQETSVEPLMEEKPTPFNSQMNQGTSSKADEKETNTAVPTDFDPSLPPEEFMDHLVQHLKSSNLQSDTTAVKRHMILDLWDFAGQHLYYASYPVFLSTRAVYMLVYNLSKGLKDTAQPCFRQGVHDILLENPNNENNLENLLSWLVSLSSLCSLKTDASERTTKLEDLPYFRPPVFIVGTHADEPHEDIKEMELQIQREISGKDYERHVIRPFFSVDNRQGSSDEGVVALQKRMIEVLKQEPYMGEEVPIRWFNFEKVVEALIDRKVYYLNLKQLQSIIQNVCFIEDEDEVATLLNFYHDLGIIVRHRNTVILQAQWLIEVFKQLITIRCFDEMEPRHSKFWKEMETTGALHMELVDHVFSKYCQQGLIKEDILNLMEQFGLIAKSITSPTNEMYFVPCQLKTPPEALCVMEPSPSDPCPLYLHFLGGFVPHGFFWQLVSRITKWSSESGFTQPPRFFLAASRFVIAKKSTQHELIVLCKKRFIKIVLRHSEIVCGASFSEARELAILVRRFLEETVQNLRRELPWLGNLRCDFCVACPGCLRKEEMCSYHNVVSCDHEDCLCLLKAIKEGQLSHCPSSQDVKVPTVFGLEKWFAAKGYHRGTEDVYNMTARPRGITLIINNASFADHPKHGQQSPRHGSEEDVRQVTELFTALDFSVRTKQNLSRQQLLHELDVVACRDHSAYDCFVLWLMSHGKSGEVFCSDGNTIPIETLHDMFSNCNTLSGKPKLFFIQACRGDGEDEGVSVAADIGISCYEQLTSNQVDSPIDAVKKPAPRVPTHADFLYAFSTVDEHVSYRHEVLGSYYVRGLVEAFRERAVYDHLLDILTVVNQKVGNMEANMSSVEDKNEIKTFKQMPEVKHTLRKKVHF